MPKRLWIRLYTSVVNDPKVQLLPDHLFRFWINCLCLAGLHDGCLPTDDLLAFSCRFPQAKLARDLLGELEARHLVHHVGGKLWKMHDWEEYQYDSDISTQRVKRFRNGQRNVSETVAETHQSRAEQNRADIPSDREQASSTVLTRTRAVVAPQAAAAGSPARKPPARAANAKNGNWLDALLHDVFLALDEEGVALPPRYVRNGFGREERNPVSLHLENALVNAEGRIRNARDPRALARHIILDALKENPA